MWHWNGRGEDGGCRLSVPDMFWHLFSLSIAQNYFWVLSGLSGSFLEWFEENPGVRASDCCSTESILQQVDDWTGRSTLSRISTSGFWLYVSTWHLVSHLNAFLSTHVLRSFALYSTLFRCENMLLASLPHWFVSHILNFKAHFHISFYTFDFPLRSLHSSCCSSACLGYICWRNCYLSRRFEVLECMFPFPSLFSVPIDQQLVEIRMPKYHLFRRPTPHVGAKPWLGCLSTGKAKNSLGI